MPPRISRRRLVGWLARSASALTMLALLEAGDTATADASATHGKVLSSGERTARAVEPVPGPVAVRMTDLVLTAGDLRAGQVDGVRLPGQGGTDPWSLTAERAGGTYTSPPLLAEFPCTHVGVRWQTEAARADGLRVEVRASRDGRTWNPWRTVQPERHGPDRQPADQTVGQVETFGALVGARLGRWLQVRLTFTGAGPMQASVTGLTLTCLDSRRSDTATGPAPALTSPSAGAAAMSALPAPTSAPPADRVFLRAGLIGFLDRVVSREAWGADESLRFKDGTEVWPTAFVHPSLLVVHHTATDGDLGDPEADVRAIYAYHAVTQGWGDIGYHLLIDSTGRIYEGRRGRDPSESSPSGQREIVSENVVAGHALDYNYGSVGIALLGNYQLREPSPVMLDALVDALSFMAQRAGLDPTTVAAYPRARSDGTVLWRDGLDTLAGHRDCISTECPGDNVYRRLPDIRARVAETLGGATPSIRITRGPTDRNFWPGDLVFAWEADPSVVEFSTRLAGWVRVPGSDRIAPLTGYTDDERPVWSAWARHRDLSVPLPPDARGIYTLFVRARDASGRVGQTVARWHLAVDRHVVVDDTDALRTRHEGDWQRSKAVLGYYGLGYQVAAAGQADGAYQWQLAVPEDGIYELLASWTEAEDRTTQATYQLSQGGQPLGEASVSQQETGGRWVVLLQAALRAGVPCVVEVAGADDGTLVADAVRLVRLP